MVSPRPDKSSNTETVETVIQGFAGCLTWCDAVAVRWVKLGKAVAEARNVVVRGEDSDYSELPVEVNTFAKVSTYKNLRRANRNGRDWRIIDLHDACDDLVFAVREWRASLDSLRELIPQAAPWTDDLAKPSIERWTARVRGQLGDLGGLIHRHTVGDLPERLDKTAWRSLVDRLHEALNELKTVRTLPDPRSGLPEDPPPKGPGTGAGSSFGIDVSGADRPTSGELATAAGISDDTFRRVRRAAGIEVGLRGALARNRRYSAKEVDRLITAALAGAFLEGRAMGEKWRRWGSR